MDEVVRTGSSQPVIPPYRHHGRLVAPASVIPPGVTDAEHASTMASPRRAVRSRPPRSPRRISRRASRSCPTFRWSPCAPSSPPRSPPTRPRAASCGSSCPPSLATTVNRGTPSAARSLPRPGSPLAGEPGDAVAAYARRTQATPAARPRTATRRLARTGCRSARPARRGAAAVDPRDLSRTPHARGDGPRRARREPGLGGIPRRRRRRDPALRRQARRASSATRTRSPSPIRR